jgi:cellulose synthase/poly-beta-1,6-N-acetylglucosamine synthase-like glycosyltransferase
MIALILLLLVFIVSVPALFFVLECLIGVTDGKQVSKKLPKTSAVATILIPAHNESEIISNTLEALKKSVAASDRVLVVADNCSDDTAEIARSYGFEAVERQDAVNRGKGFALDYGRQIISEAPSDMVIVVDADCIVDEPTLELLKSQCAHYQTPIQAKYLIKNQGEVPITAKVSEFAFAVRNILRMRGLHKLGISLPLLGTGMAFPWSTFSNMKLASSDIVEDMKLGIELASDEQRVRYCEEAFVYSYFPTTDEARETQRQRWEHGHLDIINRFFPLLLNRIASGKLQLIGVLLDISIPPLTLLVAMLGAMVVISGLGALFFNAYAAFQLGLAVGLLMALSIVLAWFSIGKSIMSFADLMGIPRYILSKAGIYKKFIKGKETKWIRTDRK